MKKLTHLLILFSTLFFLRILPAFGELADYRHEETRVLVKMAEDASRLIEAKGDAAFPEFKKEVSIWHHGDMYIFILDSQGNMVTHPDAGLEGKNQLDLKDINGKQVIRDIIRQAAGSSGQEQGWSHYQWVKPHNGPIAWKTTYSRVALSPEGKKYIVSCGLYDMKMEKNFIIAVVDAAAALIEKEGRAAFPALRDRAGPFFFKDTYVFVTLSDGTELVNPAFPEMEGRNLMGRRDSAGNYMTREYINTALTKGKGWVTYLWPKPGKNQPLSKSSYVKKAVCGKEVFIVGCGEYFD